MDLLNANRQWASRPADERFPSLEALHAFVAGRRQRSREKLIEDPKVLKVVPEGENLSLVGPKNIPVPLSYRAFYQLAIRAKASPGFLTELSAPTAAIVLNERIQQRGGLMIGEDFGREGSKAKGLNILFEQNGSMLVRAVTSDIYARIWDVEIVERLMDLASGGDWTVPPARSSQGSDASGLYAGDRDLFAFMVNEKNRIQDGSDGGLARGFFIQNSEVGEASFQLITFLYRYVCGNHIVWGAENVTRLWVRHVGRAHSRAFDSFRLEIRKYADRAASLDEARIKSAKSFLLGAKREDVVDLVFGKKLLTRQAAGEAYDLARQNDKVDGAPNSAWGFAQGITRLSQGLQFANERTDLDVAAGRILDLAVAKN